MERIDGIETRQKGGKEGIRKEMKKGREIENKERRLKKVVRVVGERKD